QTFSRGYPNFVSEFSLFEDVTNSDLEEALEVTFPEDESIMPIEDTHTYLKRIGKVTNSEDEVVLKLQYEKYKDENDIQGRVIKGPLEIKSTFDIIFDFQIMRCFIKCGDRRQLSFVDKIIRSHITRVF